MLCKTFASFGSVISRALRRKIKSALSVTYPPSASTSVTATQKSPHIARRCSKVDEGFGLRRNLTESIYVSYTFQHLSEERRTILPTHNIVAAPLFFLGGDLKALVGHGDIGVHLCECFVGYAFHTQLDTLIYDQRTENHSLDRVKTYGLPPSVLPRDSTTAVAMLRSGF